MFDPIGRALLQGVTPVVTSATSISRSESSLKKSADQSEGQSPPPPDRPQLRVIGEESEAPLQEDAPKAPPVEPDTQIKTSTLAFMQILNLIRDSARPVSRWIGISSYRLAQRGQKKGGKFKKGTLINLDGY